MTKNTRALYRGIYGFTKCYHPRTNIVKGEKVDLVADSHSILVRRRNHYSQPFNMNGVSDVRQTNTNNGAISA
jgi:hypothetical protein